MLLLTTCGRTRDVRGTAQKFAALEDDSSCGILHISRRGERSAATNMDQILVLVACNTTRSNTSASAISRYCLATQPRRCTRKFASACGSKGAIIDARPTDIY